MITRPPNESNNHDSRHVGRTNRGVIIVVDLDRLPFHIFSNGRLTSEMETWVEMRRIAYHGSSA